MCGRLWPGYWKLSTQESGTCWRSTSHSTVFSTPRRSRAIVVALAVRLGEDVLVEELRLSSIRPAARCSLVPAAGICPLDSEVLPEGLASRSRITASAPFSFAASAAMVPQAPAPITSTSVCVGNVLPSAFSTGID